MIDLDDVRKEVHDLVREFPDFPKKGILFRDIMPIMAHPGVLDRLCRAIAAHYKGKVDAVAGLEARGFLFGPQVAILLGVPFVPIRKKGKLPGELLEASYEKEYGLDVVQIQKDAIRLQQRVLIIDDLLATGGTLHAAFDLIQKAGAVVAEAFVLIELGDLNGREKLGALAANVKTLLLY